MGSMIPVLPSILPHSKPSSEVFETIINAAHDWLYSFLPFLGRGTPATIVTALFILLGVWAVLAWIRGN